ncbi:hypothetical protein KP509_01G130000 [Ceratopteris richardii]|nr:hypothetical protein KP509_01G130000 [Ceratopteris richardii]
MNVLTSNHGILKAVHRTSHGNRQFGFQLSNVQSSAAIITVSLDTSHVLSRAGTVARAPDAVTFLYDMVKPKVKLAVSSLGFETRDRIISVAVVFTKPVFLFTLKSVTAINGRVTRLDEISKSLYLVHVLANEGMTVTLFVPENKTVDIAGNLNDPSSILHVKHYFVPAVSIGLYSFTTASFLATTFAAGVLSVSAASLAAVGALTQTAMKSIVSDPSKNLLNMAGHLQVFALSSRLAVGLPVEYIETARGLQWLIPSVKPPWEHEKKLPSIHWNRKMPDQIFTSATVNMLIAERARGRILAANATLYGPALLPAEYNIYFSVQNFNTLSATDNLLADRNNGWHDFESNMFWLGISAMILIFLHLLTLAIFKWKFRSAATGALIFPRFELFILIYALPGFCQAVASIIRGGTMKGLIIGVFLLAIPASFLFSVVLFLGVAVIAGRFVQYNEVRWGANANGWCTRAWLCIIGYKTVGTWSCKGELPSSFLGRFGLLFEDRKGPSHVITVSSDKSESLQHWVGSGSSGIGSKKVEDFKDESSDAVVSGNGKVLGAAQATYIAVDLTRRVVLGITFGAYDPNSLSWCQPSIILGSTVVQLLYLIGFRPYIKRGLQLVETLSFLCEALFFALSFAFLASSPVDDHTLGMAMLALLLSTLVLQLGNEWHALMNQLLELSPTQTPSLKVGAKMLLWGLVLPFIPDKWCSKFMSNFPGQPNRGLVTVVPVSQEEILPPVVQQMEGAKNVALGPKVPSSDETGIEESTRAVADPNAAGECICSHLDMSVGAHGKKSWCTTTSSELKTLRELAKASFLQSQKEDSITRFNGASKSVQAHSRMTSLGSLEHPAPSRSALHSFHPPGISSEGSSSADLEIIER